ncbi:bifunctional alpha/beta hydrolase/OsmC family protein [Pararhodonellum marinum]|uniref:bifunctional alpha/beta hydrolase/OsmC family protein n=1 Tax=Pararhodonellum marinum TaxID=2755358 RepID=UPI00188ED2BE|nr:bifunctional alpha/beta hydrolase/OsmC family protein [Pararhodonellum marinum]
MKIEKVSFENKNGFQLSARLYHPLDEIPRFYAIFAHCFTCSKNFSAVSNISDALCREGIAVLSFDFTGLGNSEGDFEDTDFSSNVQDLIDAAKYLEEHFEAPELLVGHSLGGAASILAADQIESVLGVVTIGSPAKADHATKLFKDQVDTIKEKGSAKVNIGGKSFYLKKEFVEDLEQQKLLQVLKDMRKSILIFHSPQDEIVDISNAAELYQAAYHPKSFISLDQADHLLNDVSDSQYVGQMISSWSDRYLTKASESHDTKGHQVKVRLSGKHYTSEIKTPDHHLVADEPTDLGGKNLGPTPYDLLMAALGACTVMTLKMYAERKKWDLKEVTVYLDHDKVHKKDSEDVEKPEAKVSRFSRALKIEGKLDDEQLKRLVEIANRCPVHRTLHEEIVVETKLL